MFGGYAVLLADPAVHGFVAFGLLGRMAISMLSLGIILLVSGLTGSYGAAGLVAGASVLAGAVGAPLLGRLADRYGQGRVVTFAVPVHCAGLGALMVLAVLGLPGSLLALPAMVAGAAYPPIGSFVRARWAHRLGDSPRLTTAYAFESVVDELIFVTGPVVVTLLATRVHPAAGLLAAFAVTVLGGIGFARQRRTDPPPRPPTGSRDFVLRTPAVLAVTLLFLAGGATFGAIDVAVVAFTSAEGLRWAAGLVLALFAAGSATGGLSYGAVRWRADPLTRVAGAGTVFGLAFLPLVFVPSVPWLAPFALLAGLAISPLVVAGNTLVQQRVRPGGLTEALTWVLTGILVGVAFGSWATGRVVDVLGGQHGFLVVTPAAGLTALGTWTAWLALRHTRS